MPRLLFLPLSAILLLVTFGSLSPAAAARYCLQGAGWGFPGNCQFSSLRQCQATASGTNASCGRNPRYAYARQRGNAGTQPPVNNGWNNNYGWNNSGWNNPGWNGNPNNRPGLVGGSDVGTYRP
jgi:Protein of unknown function (DUF3551)